MVITVIKNNGNSIYYNNLDNDDDNKNQNW